MPSSFFHISGIRFVDKGLGRSLGQIVRMGQASEFDGDGDGFLTGPDGVDNIPAPAEALVDDAADGVLGLFKSARADLESRHGDLSNPDNVRRAFASVFPNLKSLKLHGAESGSLSPMHVNQVVSTLHRGESDPDTAQVISRVSFDGSHLPRGLLGRKKKFVAVCTWESNERGEMEMGIDFNPSFDSAPGARFFSSGSWAEDLAAEMRAGGASPDDVNSAWMHAITSHEWAHAEHFKSVSRMMGIGEGGEHPVYGWGRALGLDKAAVEAEIERMPSFRKLGEGADPASVLNTARSEWMVSRAKECMAEMEKSGFDHLSEAEKQMVGKEFASGISDYAGSHFFELVAEHRSLSYLGYDTPSNAAWAKLSNWLDGKADVVDTTTNISPFSLSCSGFGGVPEGQPLSSKALGPKISRVRRGGKPSDVDGDGDGFVTGPDGEDNVPAPVVNAPDWVKNFGGVEGFVREHRNEAGEDVSPAELFERSGMSRDRFVEVRGAARASVNDDAEAIVAEANVEHEDVERARGNVGKIDAVGKFYDERRDAAFERLVAEVRRWEKSSDKSDPKKVAEHEKVYEKLLEEFLFEKTRAEVFEGRKRVLRDQVQDKFLERLARLSGERPREGAVRIDVPEDVAAEAARRVDNALVKRQRLLGNYLRGRYKDSEAPWLEMSAKRRKRLVAAADEGDEDAINELLDWAKQAYSHDKIVGKNGREYRVEVAARYITGGDISLYAQFFDSDGESVGESERLIRALGSDRGYVLNKRLFIDEEHKNSGVGGIYISHANMYLNAAGLKKAAVQTTDDGPFVWAKLGFSEPIVTEYVDNMHSQLRRYNNGRVSIIDNDLDAEIINYLLERWDSNPDSVRHIDFIFALSNKNAPGTRAFEQRDQEIRDWFVDYMPLEAGDFDFVDNNVLSDPRVLLRNIEEKSLARFNLIDGRLVKVLGPKLGDSRKPTKPSDIDGDGDGFVTGVDGQDNVPAPVKTILDLFKGKDRRQILDMLVAREQDVSFSDSELADLGLSKSEFDDLLASGFERGEQRFAEIEQKLKTKPKSSRAAEKDFYEAPDELNQIDLFSARRELYESIESYQNTIKTNGDNQDLVEQARKKYEDALRKYIVAVGLRKHRKDNTDRYNSIANGFQKRWNESIQDEADVAGGILEKIDPTIKQEAKDRVDDGIQKRLEIFANYIDKRYGDDASPWAEMYPSRLDRLARRAQDGDDQAIRELEAWAKQMYSHDEIIGKNGKKYRIKATALYYSDNDSLEIGAVIYHVNEYGEEIHIGDSIRTINDLASDNPSITNHEMFIRDSKHKNSGIATIYNYHAFLYGAAAGIEDADVGAVDDGPFVWAKMGFRGKIYPGGIENIAKELNNFQRGRSSIIKDPTDAEIIDYLINQWKATRSRSSGMGQPTHLDFIMALSNKNQPGSTEYNRRAAEIKEWFLDNMPMDSGRFNFAANGITGDPRKALKNSTKSLNVLDLSGVRLVKGLGSTIGGKPRVGKPSEVDGDGDGFVTGADGEDNVPAPLPKIFEKWKNASRNTLEGWFSERTNEDGIGFSDSDLADIGISREDFDNFVERGRNDAYGILEQAREIASATPSGISDAKFNRQMVSDIRMRVWQILRIRERKTIDQHSRFVEKNPESARQTQEEVQKFQAEFLQFFQAYGAAMRVREQEDEWDDLEKRLLKTIRDLQDKESVDAENILANLDPKIRAEAERRVKNVIEKRARVFGKYVLDRYGEDEAPWLDMTPERRIKLGKAAADGDDDARWELQNWAREMYSHDEIIGRNGEKYRVTALAEYFGGDIKVTTKIWHVDANEDEHYIGKSERVILGLDKNVPDLYNVSLFIEQEGHKGQGIAGIYNSHAFMYAKAAGLTEADVSAADEGPYVWARLGFRGDISQENIDTIKDHLREFDEGDGDSDLIRNKEDAEIIRYLIAKWVKNNKGKDSPRHIDFMMALSNTERPGSVAWDRRQRQIKNFFLDEFPLDSGVFVFDENMVLTDPRKLINENSAKALNILAGFGLISTKALGSTLGRARRVGQVSEVDGDGDGFITGPDGEDNVPAPKQLARKYVAPNMTEVFRYSNYLFNNELSDDEQDSIGDYVEGGYGDINGYFRRGSRDEDIVKVAKIFDDAFNKASIVLGNDETVYRGMSLSEDSKTLRWIQKLEVGDEFKDMGFVSTSSEKSQADIFANRGEVASVMFVIKTPKGTEVIVGNRDESEIILRRGSQFVVTEIDKTVRGGKESYKIEMELLL